MAVIRDSRKYPEYEYHEFPKWVKDKEGKRVLVHSKSEEESIVQIEEESVEETEEEEIRNERSRRRRG